jgi:hypothetical protein
MQNALGWSEIGYVQDEVSESYMSLKLYIFTNTLI